MASKVTEKKTLPVPPLLRHFFTDIGAQPEWRGPAAIDMAWKDNKQWTKEQKLYFKSLGMPEDMFVNLMGPALDAVTGYEAKHRVDWMITAAGEEHEEMAEGLNHKLNDELRLADANQACADAYEPQAGVGLGWVYVGRSQDLLAPSKLLIEDVHRDEIFWDMRSRSASLKRDCRWIARRKFFDKDEATALLPGHAQLINFTFSDWQTIDIAEGGLFFEWFNNLNQYTDPIELIMEHLSDRPRVAIYEVYYKVVEFKTLMFLADGQVFEPIPGSNTHLELLATGQARLHHNIPVNVTRVAWFIGPHMIYDGPSPHPHNEFPFVPFFGIREDATNSPVGLLRRMRGPQEQYNRAVIEIQHILRSIRIEKDYDALHKMSDPQAVYEATRANGVINLKHNKNFKIVREWQKLDKLEKICDRAKEEINLAGGIYQTFQGRTEQKQSGVAVENIAELGAQTLGKINANYQYGRKQVGDLSYYHIVDIVGERPETVHIPRSLGQQRKTVKLNDGVNNKVQLMRAQIALQDVHTSSGYRNQMHQRITGIMDKLPPDLVGTALPFWVETSEMPKKDLFIKLINQKLGHIEDEEERAAFEEKQRQDAEQLKELEVQTLLLEQDLKKAETAEKYAKEKDLKASALKKRIEAAKEMQEIRNMGKEPIDRRQRALPGPTGV